MGRKLRKPDPIPPETQEAVKQAREEELENELHRIYDDGGKRTNAEMTRLDQARSSTVKRLLIGLTAFFAVLAAVSWAGFFFFSPDDRKFSGELVTLSVEGPSEAKSGELVSYAVRYKNGEAVPLGTASLEVRLPRSFRVQKTEPSSEKFSWQLGSIAPEKDGIVTIWGVFVAPLEKEMDIQAILTYRPADFNSEFQKVETKTLMIKDSVMELAVTGPAKVLPGDKVTISFDYHNASENTFENIRLIAEYPEHFIPETTEPATDAEKKNEWPIASVGPDGKGTLTVTGSFASAAEGGQVFKGRIGFLGEEDAFELQRESTFTADVLKGDLVTGLILNGKAEDQPIRFGDLLRFAVTWRNTGTATLGNVALSVVFETTPRSGTLLWNNLKDKARGVREDGKITWTKKQVPSLARVGADEEGTLDFEIPLLAEPDPSVKDGIYQVTAWLEASVETIDGETVNRATKTQPLTAKVVSDAKVSSDVRYFNEDGIPVGSGPLPPKVGEGTTYRVSWKIENSLHELTDLKLTAKLPPNVRWNGTSSVDAGDLRFDAAGEKMAWTLNWMPTSIRSLIVSYDVTVTPTPDQQGKLATLVDATIFEAVDKVTGASIILSQPPLTTALENDENAAGKGRVQ